jgi:hypothetical protein
MVAGYEVLEGSNVVQLEVGLRARSVSGAGSVLFVLGARLAEHCALSIAAVARERARIGLDAAQLILTYEFGSLLSSPQMDLAPCLARGAFEKPFDLAELQELALLCRRPRTSLEENGAASS